jgi:alkyl sulfatase BDS1-like metallo-beta-lactamase superfamily hydrolase
LLIALTRLRFYRAEINRYLGYWGANPATLIPLSPKNSAPLYVEMMGAARLVTQIEDRIAKVQGNADTLNDIAGVMVNFSLGFEILPGTVSDPRKQDKIPFEQDDFADTSGG